jgi:hypothetical protein
MTLILDRRRREHGLQVGHLGQFRLVLGPGEAQALRTVPGARIISDTLMPASLDVAAQRGSAAGCGLARDASTTPSSPGATTLPSLRQDVGWERQATLGPRAVSQAVRKWPRSGQQPSGAGLRMWQGHHWPATSPRSRGSGTARIAATRRYKFVIMPLS